MSVDDVIEFIRTEKSNRKISVRKMSKDTGIMRPTINSWIYSIHYPRLDSLIVLLDYLGFELRIVRKGND